MSKFHSIDPKLEALAMKLPATLKKNRGGRVDFEERRLDWKEGDTRKAIIIQPHFGSMDVDSSFWYLTIGAWKEKNGRAVKPGWWENLVGKSDFSVIEQKLDELLTKAEAKLNTIKPEDLKSWE